MRSFEEEAQRQLERRSAGSPLARYVSKAMHISEKQAYGALIGVGIVLLIAVVLIVVALTSGSYSTATAVSPRVVLILVPGIHPQALETAMASNKAPVMQMLTLTGAAYGRVASNTTDTTAALVTLLTGAAASMHNVTNISYLPALYGGVPTFAKYAKDSELRPALFASQSYFSSGVSNYGVCSNIGILDVECVGQSCPGTTSYCNAYSKFVLADGDTSLYGTTIGSNFADAVAAPREVTVVLLNAFDQLRNASDDNLRALSTVALLDGLVGQVALAIAQRSAQNSENWLLVVGSDGVNTVQQAPLLVSSYIGGNPQVMTPIDTAAGNIADVFATAAAWLGFPNSLVGAGKVQGALAVKK